MNDKRLFQRFGSPQEVDGSPSLLIFVPEISEAALTPDDFSAGGFKVHSPKQLEPGTLLSCTIRSGDVAIEGCKAQVAWVEESSDGNGCMVGIALDISEEVRDNFSSILTAILSGETPESL
ncbi:MAG: PilZ domain-containing protein [bacterium]|nr:PilZ domain-containing protein [bacterium]